MVLKTTVGAGPILEHGAKEEVSACTFDAASVAEEHFALVSVLAAKEIWVSQW